jgi:hypothetical protein
MDKMHKGINWATVAGVVVTALFTYFGGKSADAADVKLASGVAEQLAVLKAAKRECKQDTDALYDEVTKLREAVAVLRASNEFLARSDRERARNAADALDNVFYEDAPKNVPTQDVADAQEVREIKKSLLKD